MPHERVLVRPTLWSRELTDVCDATVGPTFVYYTTGAGTTALRRSDGTIAWRALHTRGASPTALHGGRLWHTQTHYAPVLDAATGATAGGRHAYTWRRPAFAGDLAFISVGENETEPDARMLQAVDVATGAVRWEFGAERGIFTAPTVAGGTVYVASERRSLFGLRPTDGRLQWCTSMPDPADSHTEVVAGEGVLLIAAGNSITVYEPGGAPGCDYRRVARPGWDHPTGGAATTTLQAFESDAGQLPPGVRFAASAPGHQLQVTASGARLTTAAGVLGIHPVGASGPRSTRGERRLAGLINLIGARGQHVRIRRYERVRQRETWPGIDLVYRLSGAVLEYDLVVRPGAELGRARIALDGAEDVRLDPDGALVARFVLHADGTIGFAVPGRDPERRLVVDPVLGVSGFLGGWLHDEVTDVAVDATGHVYVTGWTASRDFPTRNSLTGWHEWNAMCAHETCADAFVAKYAPGGRSLVYLTLLSGARQDQGTALVADASGHAYVTGSTTSPDFPLRNAAQPRYGGTFVAKLAPDGSALVWSTFHGGSGFLGERANDIALDATGSAFVAGETDSMDMPTTAGAADRVCSASTYAPTCSEAWVVKYSPAGDVVYSTYFGGDQGWERGTGIAVDRAGRAVFGGWVSFGFDFPATPGAYDTTPTNILSEPFAGRLNRAGTAVEWATSFGGTYSTTPMRSPSTPTTGRWWSAPASPRISRPRPARPTGSATTSTTGTVRGRTAS